MAVASHGKFRGTPDQVYLSLARRRSPTWPFQFLQQNPSAYPERSSGWLGVTAKQFEDVNSFHKKWYLVCPNTTRSHLKNML
jgi:hypothetical protein